MKFWTFRCIAKEEGLAHAKEIKVNLYYNVLVVYDEELKRKDMLMPKSLYRYFVL